MLLTNMANPEAVSYTHLDVYKRQTWDRAMVKHKFIDWICIGAAVLAALLTLLLMFGEQLGIPKASANPGYVTRLFDDSRVHTIDIQIEDWGTFIENAESEEYVACTVEIDGEEFRNIGLRAKGNNSLRLTEEYGLSRYSLKLEFDHDVFRRIGTPGDNLHILCRDVEVREGASVGGGGAVACRAGVFPVQGPVSYTHLPLRYYRYLLRRDGHVQGKRHPRD